MKLLGFEMVEINDIRLKTDLLLILNKLTRIIYSGNKPNWVKPLVIDDFNREGLAIVPSKSITSQRVITELENLKVWRGLPEKIRVDNGPEFIAERLCDWCKNNDVELTFIQPGKPAQNGYIERFNRSFREEVLSMNLFTSIDTFKTTAHQWLFMYNHKRPHASLSNLSPRNFLLKHCKEEFVESLYPTFQIDN